MRIDFEHEKVEWEVRLADGEVASGVRLHREWEGGCCRLSLENTGAEPRRIGEVVAFRCGMPYEADTPFYGESYNMLSQYKGTLSSFEWVTGRSDASHYRLPEPEGRFLVYNLFMLYPKAEDAVLMGFSSCRRFSGEFHFTPDILEVVLRCEGVEVGAGERMQLE